MSTSVLQRLGEVFQAANHRLYLVGGSVRDRLLHREVHDYDLATDALPAEVKRLVRRAGATSIYTVGEKFGTIGAIFDGITTEITTFRGEAYKPLSRKPEVRFGTTLLEDLARRDFTINAMAQDVVTGEMIDPFGGREDLQRRTIRAVGEAAERFAEDPLRLLRAVRFAAQLGFSLDPTTAAAIVEQADLLATISRERIAEEMDRILTSPHAAKAVRQLCDLGLMRHIVPEVLDLRGMQEEAYHHKDVFEHTLTVLDSTPPRLAVRWAALLHDIAKPRTRRVEDGQVHFHGHEVVGESMARRILSNLRYDRATIQKVARLVRMHQWINSYDETWTDGAVRRLMREAGDDLDDLVALSRADVTSRRPEKVKAAARRIAELEARIAHLRAQEDVAKLRSPLDGNELMALFGRGPGPWIKPIKERLLAMVLDGTLAPDDKERAAEIARQMVEAMERGGEGPTAGQPSAPRPEEQR